MTEPGLVEIVVTIGEVTGPAAERSAWFDGSARAERPGTLIDHRPRWGRLVDTLDDAVARLVRSLHRLQSRERMRAHVRRSCPNPRRQSLVRHLVQAEPDRLVEFFGRRPAVQVSSTVSALRCTHRGSPAGGIMHLDGQLSIRRIRRPMPVRLTVEPWWRGRSTLSLELRPRRGRRYSRRYFDGAHQALSALGHEVVADVGVR